MYEITITFKTKAKPEPASLDHLIRILDNPNNGYRKPDRVDIQIVDLSTHPS